ncbi:MAG: DUF3237 domain-containing protein [Rhodoferax sp.]|nr:DUF3237 domain-containing protein [Rhodoferax sp.]
MDTINVRSLMTMTAWADTSTANHIGNVPAGYARRVTFVTGGTFEGERLRGRVLPAGGDFLILRPDGAMHLDVRLVLETDQGELIYITYVGRRYAPPEVMARYVGSEAVDADAEYFRTLVQFECASPRLLWLNNLMAVGFGSRSASGVTYRIVEIL